MKKEGGRGKILNKQKTRFLKQVGTDFNNN